MRLKRNTRLWYNGLVGEVLSELSYSKGGLANLSQGTGAKPEGAAHSCELLFANGDV